jgi:creatinine amidohydrolase
VRIGDMNWMQVEEYLTVDCILPERVATDAAEPLGVPVFPVVPYGVTPYFREFRERSRSASKRICASSR